MPDRYCYVCRRRDGDLIPDEEEGEERHPECSISNVANRLPVTIGDLKVGLESADLCLLQPSSYVDPYREGWGCLRSAAHIALQDLQKLEIPPARTVDQVLAEIIAEGHEVDLDYRDWRAKPDLWRCTSRIDVDTIVGEGWEDRRIRAHTGERDGATALEAATRRLEFIRVGKMIGVLFSWFVPVVDVEIRDAIAELNVLIPPPDSDQIEEA